MDAEDRGSAGERQFVDSNVLVYLHDRSAGSKQSRAREIVDELWESRRGCLSIQVLQEFYVNVTRKVPRPLSPETARGAMDSLSVWTLHHPRFADLIAASEVQERYQISFWDGMIVRSAVALSCGVIWSEDLNDGQVYEGVRVVNPF